MDFLIPLVKNLKDTDKDKSSPDEVPPRKRVNTNTFDLKSKVKKKDTEHIKRKVRKTKTEGSDPKSSAKKLKTITSHLSEDLYKESPGKGKDCGRVLKSNFTITNLLNDKQPQIILSLPSMDLDEDYD